jgi:hypothetical protein
MLSVPLLLIRKIFIVVVTQRKFLWSRKIYCQMFCFQCPTLYIRQMPKSVRRAVTKQIGWVETILLSEKMYGRCKYSC